MRYYWIPIRIPTVELEMSAQVVKHLPPMRKVLGSIHSLGGASSQVLEDAELNPSCPDGRGMVVPHWKQFSKDTQKKME